MLLSPPPLPGPSALLSPISFLHLSPNLLVLSPNEWRQQLYRCTCDYFRLMSYFDYLFSNTQISSCHLNSKNPSVLLLCLTTKCKHLNTPAAPLIMTPILSLTALDHFPRALVTRNCDFIFMRCTALCH